jgi:hypothetical protein
MSGQRAQLQHKESSKQIHSAKKAPGAEKPPETFAESPNPLLSIVQGASAPPDLALTPQNISLLHRTIGNRAAGRIIQAKLKIGKPGDMYEREADVVASRISEGHPVGPISRLPSDGFSQPTSQSWEDEEQILRQP